MGPLSNLAFHVRSSHPTPSEGMRGEEADDTRLATTSLIIARRVVASVNGNPEFDAATMLRPYTYAYVSTFLLSPGLI